MNNERNGLIGELAQILTYSREEGANNDDSVIQSNQLNPQEIRLLRREGTMALCGLGNGRVGDDTFAVHWHRMDSLT